MTTTSALELKEEANRLFREEKYCQAIVLYTQAIDAASPPRPEFYTNRASAHFQMGDFLAAREDASRAVELDPLFTKGYWRMAECDRVTQKLQESLKWYRKALETKPTNRKIVAACRDVQSLLMLSSPKQSAGLNLLKALHSIPVREAGVSTALSSYFGRFGGSMFGAAGNAPEVVDESDRMDTPALPALPEPPANAVDAADAAGADAAAATAAAGTSVAAGALYTEEWLRSVVDYTVVRGKIFRSDVMVELCRRAADVLSAEPTCVELTVGADECLCICGDLHGSQPDMRAVCDKILLRMGQPLESGKRLRVAFLGDYVDRGTFGHQIVTALLCFKLAYPDRLLLIRGNHESISMNNFFGYQGQVENAYGLKSGMFNVLSELFGALPLCASLTSGVTGERAFLTHGGAPVVAMLDAAGINRQLPARRTEMSDPLSNELSWSDPSPTALAGFGTTDGTKPSHRGVGYIYDFAAFKRWAQRFGYAKLFRAHEVTQPTGLRLDFSDQTDGSVAHFTVYSSSRYMGMDNKGSYVVFPGGGMQGQKEVLLLE